MKKLFTRLFRRDATKIEHDLVEAQMKNTRDELNSASANLRKVIGDFLDQNEKNRLSTGNK